MRPDLSRQEKTVRRPETECLRRETAEPKKIRQLTTAAADGAVAALAACNELAEQDREAVSEESVLAAADTAENETEEGTNA